MSWTIAPVGRGSNLIYSQAGMPSLDLRFAETKSLNDFISSTNLITFTRASNASFIDSNGLIQTATTNVPRFDHNPATGESLGLLVEEQRVNLLLNSETLATQSATVAAAAHTLSFYGTGSVVLSGAHSATVNGTGAYPIRTTLTFTPTAGSLTLTVTGTVQYANLEAGAFATSWIPTTGTTATRSADAASITGANFSRWYRQDEGTVFAIWNVQTDNAFANVYQFHNNAGTVNLIEAYRNNSDTSITARIRESAGTQRTLAFVGLQWANRVNSIAHAYAANDMQAAINGVTNPASITTMALPTITALEIGNANGRAAANCLSGHIRRLTFWPQRLPNATLQTITQV
jgi:hypothetical protein